ncbi:hypothetical protein [uncultured Kordia sp.]|uniref:hypothetical protein n=1 Tax=uncultured Kordia sp. TaxID=507699 RepID=UPI00260F2CAF|nr:hypothetical protein [uncultured Kordia sp.]
MKKRNLKTLDLNKKTISILEQISGGRVDAKESWSVCFCMTDMCQTKTICKPKKPGQND